MKVYMYTDHNGHARWFKTFRNVLKSIEKDIADVYNLTEDEYVVEFSYSKISSQYMVCLHNKNAKALPRYGYIIVKETED